MKPIMKYSWIFSIICAKWSVFLFDLFKIEYDSNGDVNMGRMEESDTREETKISKIIAPQRPLGKPPWKPMDFLWVAIIFSFGATAILIGLNWQRLGKPQRTWPTIILSFVGLIGVVTLREMDSYPWPSHKEGKRLLDPNSDWHWCVGGSVSVRVLDRLFFESLTS